MHYFPILPLHSSWKPESRERNIWGDFSRSQYQPSFIPSSRKTTYLSFSLLFLLTHWPPTLCSASPTDPHLLAASSASRALFPLSL